MDNDVIFSQFEDIEEKVDFLIELCRSLENTNSDLQKQIEDLEFEIKGNDEEKERNLDQSAIVRSKVDGLLAKLNNYSELS
ncbi:MAG: cell division protein ZapB [Desulfobacterales bacterium]|nr:cell division protein ZapB [Desulfobacterales bacterium]MCP4162392.1 cell division protein ZapB [Deltaproteobacteria bacterium]